MSSPLWLHVVFLLFRPLPLLTACADVKDASFQVPQLQHNNKEQRHLQDGGGENPYVYSKMSVLTPDPLLIDADNDQVKDKLKERFGRWHFWDGSEKIRPTTDYCGQHKYRDIPEESYPEGAWQTDPVFINHILDEGEKIVARAMEAIHSDHGRGKPLPPEGFKQRAEMFRFEIIDLTTTQITPPADYILPETEQSKFKKGGWTTQRSYNGLVRRILHAMMTNDEFVVVLGGDAVAAGHGNHFAQSYLMQFHRLLSPIFARMGVKLVTRNMAMGHGLGTVQSSLGFSSLFGQDIDLLIWDGAFSKEEGDPKYLDLFFRQGLLSSGPQGKIPFLLVGGNSNEEGFFDLLRWYHNEADIDVGQLGNAMYGVPLTTSKEQAETNLTQAFQYLRCDEGEGEGLCRDNSYCIRCWLDRNDVSNPTELFPHLENGGNSTPAGLDKASQRWWYPGWRQHQLMGRNLAYMILDAMQEALNRWTNASFHGPPLDGEKWHVTEMYDNMRTKLQTALAVEDEAKKCYEWAKEISLPPRLCRVPMKGATQHTPRPKGTSITSLVATDDASLIPVNPKKVLYEGPNVRNHCLDPGNVDVAQVVNLRRQLMVDHGNGYFEDTVDDMDFMPYLFRQIQQSREITMDSKTIRTQHQAVRFLEGDGSDDAIALGKGWTIHAEKPGECNGEYLSICGRDSSDKCPLLGYHDSIGALVGVDACGWLVLNIPEVKEGILIIVYAFYNLSPDNESLSSGDTEKQNRMLRGQRRLNAAIPDHDDFRFEFAINGQITSWNKQELLDHTKIVNRRMDATILLDKDDFTSEPKTVQLAIRVKECEKTCIFAFSHVYWA